MVDYLSIFNSEVESLANLGFKPELVRDKSAYLAMRADLESRNKQLEDAIEELRIRLNARKKTVRDLDDASEAFIDSETREAIARADRSAREQKKVDDIERGIALKRIQAEKLEKILRLTNHSDDEIRAILNKKGLL